MPKQQTVRKFTFVGGLNTEAGYLTPVPNTWREGSNMIPDIDGSLRPRYGIEFEPDFRTIEDLRQGNLEHGAFTVNEWTSVGGDGNRNWLVVQAGRRIHFFNNFGESISSQYTGLKFGLAKFHAPNNETTAGTEPIACMSVNGMLVIVASDITPILVVYSNEGEVAITATPLYLAIRDLDGINDNLSIDERPGSLSAEHLYNLANQGWTQAYIDSYYSATGRYPSNAQIWTAGRDSQDNFSPATLNKQDFGTSPAPKGKYIMDAFKQDRGEASGFGTVIGGPRTYVTQETVANPLPSGGFSVFMRQVFGNLITRTTTTVVTTPPLPASLAITQRPTATAFFAGRAWYGGVNAPGMSNMLFFSQIAENASKLSQCYQINDPTSEVLSDLLPTDGGVCTIHGAGLVMKLETMGDSLLVFADNGVWQVVGNSDSGFTADNYSIVKLSSVGCSSARSIVSVDDTVIYWGLGGIYALKVDSNSAMASNRGSLLAVQSLSELTLQSYYNTITNTAKRYASAAFDADKRIVYFAYNRQSDANDQIERFKKDSVLCFDMRLKAWYKHEFAYPTPPADDGYPYIVDLFLTRSTTSAGEIVDVQTPDGQNVTSTDTNMTVDQVVVPLKYTTNATRRLKFYTIFPRGAGLSEFTFSDLERSAARQYATLSATYTGIYNGVGVQGRDVSLTASQLTDWLYRDWNLAAWRIASDGLGYTYETRPWQQGITERAGTLFPQYVVTQYEEENLGMEHFMQTKYVHVFMEQREKFTDSVGQPCPVGSLYLQGRWDWTSNDATGKWTYGPDNTTVTFSTTGAYEMYRPRRLYLNDGNLIAEYDTGYPVVVTKNKLRGRGRVLQLKWGADAGRQTAKLLGWAITNTGQDNT